MLDGVVAPLAPEKCFHTKSFKLGCHSFQFHTVSPSAGVVSGALPERQWVSGRGQVDDQGGENQWLLLIKSRFSLVDYVSRLHTVHCLQVYLGFHTTSPSVEGGCCGGVQRKRPSSSVFFASHTSAIMNQSRRCPGFSGDNSFATFTAYPFILCCICFRP